MFSLKLEKKLNVILILSKGSADPCTQPYVTQTPMTGRARRGIKVETYHGRGRTFRTQGRRGPEGEARGRPELCLEQGSFPLWNYIPIY